jgi:prepilin-type N-terminal cleavage/methylation domain-containing protein
MSKFGTIKEQIQSGMSLIETVIALAILGIVGAAMFTALSGSTRSVITSDERTTAESLARTEMEWIKQQVFDDTVDDGDAIGTYSVVTGPTGYSFSPNPVIGNDVTGKPGIQKITFTIVHNGKNVLTLEGYKGSR